MTPTRPPSIDTPRPRGRPRVADPLTSVTTRIPTRTFDHLCALAQRHDLSVSGFLRKVLTHVASRPASR